MSTKTPYQFDAPVKDESLVDGCSAVQVKKKGYTNLITLPKLKGCFNPGRRMCMQFHWLITYCIGDSTFTPIDKRAIIFIIAHFL